MDQNFISDNNSASPNLDTPKSISKIKSEGKGSDSVANNICTCGKNPGGLCGCKSGGGCGCGSKTSAGEKNCGGCSKKGRCSCTKGTHKLEVFDWLCDLPEAQQTTQMVEVQFKNTRKSYYLNSNNLELYKGDMVAVESTPGHDIGEVTLTGKLVLLQMKKNNYRVQQGEHKRIYRVAKQTDLDKYNEAKALEHQTMLSAREIAEDLGLNMKISDVEYQGDGNKAIFYYIADERVDFRQLIKVYAERFRVKIEMKQIGARQEAGRVGGIGPCGRELCCSSSMSNFVSVSTSAARFQDISLNPQKLAGQCGKLKCCLNYEVDMYVEAQRTLPSKEIVLETQDAPFYHFKTDILSGTILYSSDKYIPANLVSLSKDRAFDIIKMNRKGMKPLTLNSDEEEVVDKPTSTDILEQDNINRFDNNTRGKKKKLNRGNENNLPRKKQTSATIGDDNKEERKLLVKKDKEETIKNEEKSVQNRTNQSRTKFNRNKRNRSSRPNNRDRDNGTNADSNSSNNES